MEIILDRVRVPAQSAMNTMQSLEILENVSKNQGYAETVFAIAMTNVMKNVMMAMMIRMMVVTTA